MAGGGDVSSSGEWTDRMAAQTLKVYPILGRDFYARDAVTVTREILGKLLVHESPEGVRAGRIVEAEAYLGLNDLAAHASKGITPRTKVLFGPPGHAYVYLIYGMYECLNLVAEPAGEAGCVLVRALEPVTGLAAMKASRPACRRAADLCSGPGKLTIAMQISRRHNGVDVTRGELTVLDAGPAAEEIAVSPRIGITQCAEWPLRFFLKGNASVSKTKTAAPALRN